MLHKLYTLMGTPYRDPGKSTRSCAIACTSRFTSSTQTAVHSSL